MTDWVDIITLQEEFEDIWCRRFNRPAPRRVGKFWRQGRWHKSRLRLHGNRYVRAFEIWRVGR